MTLATALAPFLIPMLAVIASMYGHYRLMQALVPPAAVALGATYDPPLSPLVVLILALFGVLIIESHRYRARRRQQ